jgi:hypothetical protein
LKRVLAGFANEHANKPKEELLKLLDEEVETFSSYMETLSDWRANGALSAPEKALVKSYLVAKLTNKLDGDKGGP